MGWSNTTIFLPVRTSWKRSTFSKRYQFESEPKIKDFGNQCTWLIRGKCLRFKSRCLHDWKVWTLLDIKFIVIRFRCRKQYQYHFWIGNGETEILRKSTKVFLLIRLSRNGILLYQPILVQCHISRLFQGV